MASNMSNLGFASIGNKRRETACGVRESVPDTKRRLFRGVNRRLANDHAVGKRRTHRPRLRWRKQMDTVTAAGNNKRRCVWLPHLRRSR
jgi:hypothetical protein